MNTAQHRSKAWDAFEAGDYKTAFKEYDLAIQKYPPFHPNSDMHKMDVEGLKEKKEVARKMIGWKPK